MKKCIIAPDSFKGSMDAVQICEIIEQQIAKHFPQCQVISLPVADGGEGTVDCFLTALSGERIEVTVTGPYGDSTPSFYGRFGELAVIEMAAAAGLPMVGDRKNPAQTTTCGVGELMLHAIDTGCTRILLGLGGSCTNDGGCGCAAALGARFFDESGKVFLPVGGTLDRIVSIDLTVLQQKLSGVLVTAMCDVQNPLWGSQGAASIYAPQKGADEAMVALLDQNLQALDQVFCKQLGKQVAQLPGAGAAGGMGAGILALLGGTLQSGIDAVLETVGFAEHLLGADAVFTGEGRLDGQSLRGKVVMGIVQQAASQQVPVYALVGDVGEGIEAVYDLGLTAVFSINRVAVPFSEAKKRSTQDLRSTVDDVLRLMKAVKQ